MTLVKRKDRNDEKEIYEIYHVRGTCYRFADPYDF